MAEKLDTYYAKNHKVAPTTWRHSNLSWKLADKAQQQLIAGTKDALLVTGTITYLYVLWSRS